MSGDALRQRIPPIARYRRKPLDDHQNALFYWDEAAKVMITAALTRAIPH